MYYIYAYIYIYIYSAVFISVTQMTVSNSSLFLELKTSLCAKSNIHRDMYLQVRHSATYHHSHFSLRQITFHVLNSGVQVYVSTISLDAAERHFP